MKITPYIKKPKLSKLKVGDRVIYRPNQKEYIISNIEWNGGIIWVDCNKWGANWEYFEIEITPKERIKAIRRKSFQSFWISYPLGWVILIISGFIWSIIGK